MLISHQFINHADFHDANIIRSNDSVSKLKNKKKKNLFTQHTIQLPQNTTMA